MDPEKLKAAGINTEEGISYCAEDEDFYVEMLGEFIKESEGNLKKLEESFDAENWADYRILAHSVKNTSKMIGARGFSEQAHEMELAAKEENAAKIRESHELFSAEYVSLIRKISEAI